MERQKYEGKKIIENDRSVLQFKVPQKQCIFWNSLVPLNKSRMVGGRKGKKEVRGEEDGEGAKITNH